MAAVGAGLWKAFPFLKIFKGKPIEPPLERLRNVFFLSVLISTCSSFTIYEPSFVVCFLRSNATPVVFTEQPRHINQQCGFHEDWIRFLRYTPPAFLGITLLLFVVNSSFASCCCKLDLYKKLELFVELHALFLKHDEGREPKVPQLKIEMSDRVHDYLAAVAGAGQQTAAGTSAQQGPNIEEARAKKERKKTAESAKTILSNFSGDKKKIFAFYMMANSVSVLLTLFGTVLGGLTFGASTIYLGQFICDLPHVNPDSPYHCSVNQIDVFLICAVFFAFPSCFLLAIHMYRYNKYAENEDDRSDKRFLIRFAGKKEEAEAFGNFIEDLEKKVKENVEEMPPNFA